MKHRATQLVFGLGLLLTLVTAGLHVRAYWVSDRLRAVWGNVGGDEYAEHVVQARTSPGVVSIIWTRFATARAHARIIETTTIHRGTGPPNPPHLDPWRTGRFHYWRVEHPSERGWVVERKAILPLWFPALACLTLTTAFPIRRAWNQRRRSVRVARGLCPACAYDLRGAAHERCPECGQTVAAASHGKPSCLSKIK